MTCAEFQEELALYAMDALDAGARAAVEAHLSEPHHEGCTGQLRSALAASDALARALPPLRPDALGWERIISATDIVLRPEQAEPAPPGALASQKSLAKAAPRWREPLAWFSAAAAAAALFFLQGAHLRERDKLLGAQHQAALARNAGERELASCRRDLEAMRDDAAARRTALSLLDSPTTKLVAFAGATPDVHSHVTLLVDPAAMRGVVLSGKDQLVIPQDKVAELWVIRGKEPPVPAGLLKPGAEGLIALLSVADFAQGTPDAFAISIEPGPLPSATPTQVILVGAIPKV